MADATLLQASFLGGVWSKRMQGRIDRPDYRTAMNVCLNGFPIETGAWVRRPGSRFAQITRRGRPGKLIKFDFEQAAAYNMEFTALALRLFVGPRLATNSTANVTTISIDNPSQVTLDVDPSWSNGDEVEFSGLGAVCPTLQNRTFFVNKISASPPVYSLENTIDLTPFDGTNLHWVPGTPAKLNRITTLSPPYTAAQVPDVRSVQTEIIAFLLHGSVAPQSLKVVTQPTATADATFNFAAATLVDGPYLDPTPNSTVSTYSANTGSVTFTVTSWTPGFVAGDVGRLMRFFCEPSDWDGGATYVTVNSTYVKHNGSYWLLVGNSGGGNMGVPGGSSNWAPTTAFPVWTWATITARNSATQVVATISGVDIPSNAAPATTVILTWRLGVYGGTNGYPKCGTYHEGRIWLSGALANRIDASVSNGIDTDNVKINFAPTAVDGTVGDANAISYVFNSPDANPIFWMIPDLQGVICGTKAGEWLVQPLAQGAMAPANIAARRVTRIGCANIEPRKTENTVIFVQAFGRKIMEYFADVYSGKLSGPHLSVAWKNLLTAGVAEIAYQQESSPTIWMRDNAGALIGATYKRDTMLTSQHPDFAAGHPHTLGSGRTVESICVGPSVDGSLDSLAMITSDTTGIRHVEVLTDILDEGAALGACWYLDDAVAPSSTVSNAAGANDYGSLTVNGLWHLNGKTVTMFAGGLDCGDHAVANGSITVLYGDGVSSGTAAGQFTAAFVATNPNIVVGFTYNSDGQIIRPGTPAESGARTGPALGKIRRAQKYGILVEGTSGGCDPELKTAIGLQVGTTFNKLQPMLFKNDGTGQILPVGQTATGVFATQLQSDYSLDGGLCWRIGRPLPANIAAVTMLLSTQDD